MRNIHTVVDNMLTHVPETEVEFRKALDKVKYDASFRAPEEDGRNWNQASFALQQFMPESGLKSPWQVRVLSEFSTHPVEKIAQHYGVSMEACNENPV